MNKLVSRVTFSEDLLDSISMSPGTCWKNDVGVLHWTCKNGSCKGQRNRQTSTWEHLEQDQLVRKVGGNPFRWPAFYGLWWHHKNTPISFPWVPRSDLEASIKNSIWQKGKLSVPMVSKIRRPFAVSREQFQASKTERSHHLYRAPNPYALYWMLLLEYLARRLAKNFLWHIQRIRLGGPACKNLCWKETKTGLESATLWTLAGHHLTSDPSISHSRTWANIFWLIEESRCAWLYS